MTTKFSLFGYEAPLLFTGTALFAAGFIARSLLARNEKPHIIPSPRLRLLSELSSEALSSLPYPPDALPGARDVLTPYGSIRVYEWGPEDGRKVLLCHGISTPCLSLGGVANCLVDEAGCRVMLFDLFGRGYSDVPSDTPQDIRLFSTQILMVLASSSLAWQSEGFALVGYSLGGGIVAAFTSYFPSLVNTLVLIAPSGLIRTSHFGLASRILYSEGVIPERILNSTVRRRLRKPVTPAKKQDEETIEEAGVLAPIRAEINIEANTSVILSKAHPDITIEAAVNHQVENHEGFVQAFMSSIRNGPISGEYQNWSRIGQRLSEQRQNQDRLTSKGGLVNNKVLIISGAKDSVIIKHELEADASEAFQGNVAFKFIDAGHEAPVQHGEEVAQIIIDFWGAAAAI